MRRTDLQDTKLWAHRAMIERVRRLSSVEKFQMIFDRIETGRQIEAMARKRRNAR